MSLDVHARTNQLVHAKNFLMDRTHGTNKVANELTQAIYPT